ncbi:energy transducer TonB [Commensalibacter oyaizuii]|uniref:Energy transducer TonB n=1 Tax=Commensalibacter oyaizuii TaxID=3043873 RepID=A0ABT6Q3L5_9PROT|nr:energy transducer TonB [Commensalibacter sp. TBRC 16381]MDI2091717.1 energy transducer TonB [Commensalibacter sp. TBRC 16381]
MTELYNLLAMFFSVIFFLIASLGTMGQAVENWFKYNLRHFWTSDGNQTEKKAGSKPINGVRIFYPRDMRTAGKEGKVILTCTIKISGETSDCKIERSSGEKSFDSEALSYVSKARFRPAMRNGIPVTEYNHRYAVRFSLAN